MRKILLLLTLFTSLAWAEQSLLNTYQLALLSDPVLSAAIHANSAAQETIDQARALYRPTVNFTTGLNASSVDVRFIGTTNFGNSRSATFESYNITLNATQPIYRKQNLVQIDKAKIQVEQADKTLNLARQNLILRCTEAYFAVLDAKSKLQLLVAQKTAIVQQLKQAQTRFSVGDTTITDVNEARARLDLIKAQEISAESQIHIAEQGVRALTGRPVTALLEVRENLVPSALTQLIEPWLTVAERHLSIQIQQDALHFAEQEVERLAAAHLPTLDAVASLVDSYSSFGTNGYGTAAKVGVIGLQLQVPIYQGGAVSSQVRQAVLLQQQAIDNVEAARRQVTLSTQSAYLNLSSSIAQCHALESALLSSQSQLDSTQLGYRVGVRNSVELLNAQQQFFSAKRDLIAARIAYLLNVIRLKAAAGTLVEQDLLEVNQQLVASHE